MVMCTTLITTTMILKNEKLHVCRDEYRRAISNLEILKIKKEDFRSSQSLLKSSLLQRVEKA